MSAYELHRKQWVPHPIERVFEFFADARNLEQITPQLLRFQITRVPPRMEPGARIEYTLRIHGFPVHWRTIIEKWDPPHGFVDIQAKGPYKLWHHTHRFWEENGGTWIEDAVRYELPFGILGRIVHRAFVARDVRTIFQYREGVIRKLFA